MEYEKVKYIDIGKVKSGKRLPKGEFVSEIISGNKYIRVRDINGNVINSKDVQYITNEASEKIKKYRVKTGDIIISVVGTVGSIAEIPNELDGAYLTENCDNLLIDENKCLKKYLKHYLISKYGQKQVIANIVGSTQPKLPIYGIENFDIILPKINIQKKIIRILDALDKKIEINNQINDNLFEIIKQYIKENCYNNCNIEVNALSNIGRIQGGYAFKSKDLLDGSTKNKIFKIKNISSNGIDIENTQCIYDEIANKIDKKFLLTQGNVIIAMTGAELGKTGYIYGNEYRYFLNQRVGVIRGNDIFSELYLNCIFLQDDMQNLLNSKGYGSAQPNISTTDIENIEIPIPNRNELEDFYEVCNPIYNKLILNSEQNQYLMKLRDTLLPKLMNGEIDLSNIKI